MQFIESSVLGLRAACYRLTSPRHTLELNLFPMIHVGTPEYYDAVHRRLGRCDVILFEGVRARTVRFLAMAYTLAARRRRLGLVTQNVALPLRSLGKKVVHADSSPEEFATDWSMTPWRWRIMLQLLAPLFGAWLFLTATRESIGRHLQTDDLESRDQARRWEDVPTVENALLTQRDRKLVAELASLLDQPGTAVRAGIVYGAGHMHVVTRYLFERHAYQVQESEWLDVFSYDD